MDKRNKTGYWRELFPLWGKAFEFFVPIPTWGQAMTGLFITILPIIAVFLIGNDSERFFSEATSEAMKWTFSIAWVMFIFFVSFIRANSKLYEKQKNIQVEKDKTINELTPVEGNLEIRLPDEDDNFSSGERLSVLIKNNNANADIEKCFVRLESVVRISVNPNETSKDLTLKEAEYQKNLLWNRKAFDDGTITISAGGTEVINLLEVGDRSIKFLFHENYLEKEIPSKDGFSHAYYGYAVYLRIYGKLNGQPINNSGVSFAVYGLLLPQLKKSKDKNIPEIFMEVDSKKEARLQVVLRKQ